MLFAGPISFGDVILSTAIAHQSTPEHHALNHYQIIRRNGAVIPFAPQRMSEALRNAFTALCGSLASSLDEFIRCAYQGLLAWTNLFTSATGTDQPKKQLCNSEMHTCHTGFFSAQKLNMRNAP
jgi:hypothetical protein